MESKYLTAAQISQLRSVMSDEDWLLLWVMMETGLRVGDAVSIRRASVRADGIHYTAQKTKKKGLAPISSALRAALLATGGKGFIFKGRKEGTHLSRQAAWKRIKTAAARCGLDADGVSPHAFRKVFAVETFREKGMQATREALQHTNRDTTEIYAFADWNTGDKANLPLTRADLKTIVGMVLKALPKEKP
jgi:integrase/recombinase XerD